MNMKTLFILVGLLTTALALLAASAGLRDPKWFSHTVASGSSCGFAILGGLCFVAYALLCLAEGKGGEK
jgi:hypothetical protein